jgi:hypothetical protein
MRPELPFIPIKFGPENYIISRLDLPKPVPLEQDGDGKWQLHAKYQDKFYIVEMSLIHIIAKFQETFHSLFSLDYKPYQNPAGHGYLRFHKEPRHARILATQSQLAFLPLIGKVSYELSREPTHNWEKALLKEQGLQPVRQSWIDAIKSVNFHHQFVGQGSRSTSVHQILIYWNWCPGC